MRPSTHFQSNHHHHHQRAKKESNTTRNPSLPSTSSSAPRLKISKDSHGIKKSSPPSSASTPSLLNNRTKSHPHPHPQPQQHRHPVIIYTHSPRVIQTEPKDFMALVQKLTGRPRSTENDHQPPSSSSLPPPPQQQQQQPQQDQQPKQAKPEENNYDASNNNNNNNNNNKNGGNSNVGIITNDDNESTSVLTDETNISVGLSDLHGNSCFLPSPMFDQPPNLCFNNNGIPFYNPNSADLLCSLPQPFYNYSDPLFYMPNMSSYTSPTLEAMKDYPEF